MAEDEPQFKIPDGWMCVRCEGKHEYCVDCGSIRCVCPFGMKGQRVVCEHDRDALKKIPTTCCKIRQKIVVGIITVVPEQICGIPDSELADVVVFGEESAHGSPVISFRFCPWCGKPRDPGSEARITEIRQPEPDDEEEDDDDDS